MKATIREGFSVPQGDAILDHTCGVVDLTADEFRAHAHKLEAGDDEAHALLASFVLPEGV